MNSIANATAASSESLGVLTLASGASTISSSNGSGGSTLTFANLSRALNSGTVDFVAPGGSSAFGSSLNQIRFANGSIGQVTVNTDINDPSNILPFGTVTGPSGSVDFATDLDGSIAAFTNYTTSLAAAAAVSQRLIAADPAVNGVTDLVVKQSSSDTSSVTALGLGIAALLLESRALRCRSRWPAL